MIYTCELKKDWRLRYEELFWDKDYYTEVVNKQEGWLNVHTLPCDVHMPLLENGIIEDPVVAEYCYQSEWIEDKSWWFKKVFSAPPELIDAQNIELILERLDAEADIFLNGKLIGHHRSETYPFRKDVKELVHRGENLLIIRVTSGLEYFSEFELAKIHWKGSDYASNRYIRDCGARRDDRRVYLRKPQYVYGWDWNPRIATCGIMGDARIEAYNDVVIRNAKFTTLSIADDHALIDVEAEMENLHPITTIDAEITIEVSFKRNPVCRMQREIFMTSGLNFAQLKLNIENPMLWWPNGMGQQNLYTVSIDVSVKRQKRDNYIFTAGIRTIRLITEKVHDGGRLFAFEVNGVRTFAKGGNWTPPDSIYARASREKYDTLIKEAKDANFNMIRLNGVGIYEYDYFYECCDRQGIMIWQDFTFSCGAYPDDLDWFKREVEREVQFQIRRLRNHPCIALWCGNNECQVTLESYGKYSYLGGSKPAFPRGIRIYNEIIPRLIKEYCPDIHYWNSSPFGGTDLNDRQYGDAHPWDDSFMNTDIEKRYIPEEYDKAKGRFISEFGCVGPTCLSSLYQYYGDSSIDVGSENWKLHTNEFETDTIKAAITRHYMDADGITLSEYLLYAGLFQGIMLGYGFESYRYLKNNYGALVWSYNDCRGELGWSIIDYYLKRKISYYFVKRALAHKKLIIRQDDEAIRVICMNDSALDLDFQLEYGFMSFEGVKENTKSVQVKVKAFNKAVVVANIPKGWHDLRKGVYYAWPQQGCDMFPALMKHSYFRDLDMARPDLQIEQFHKDNKIVEFTIQADKFAHGVHFDLGDDVLLSDEYFDLLPGESRRVTVYVEDEEIGAIKPKYVYVKR